MLTNCAPLVSVIIPTYCRRELVARAIKSVLAQTYANLECIVVDDASTDDTADAVRSLASADERVKCVEHDSNRHVSAARNTGIQTAAGSLIAFLDDDDIWLPRKLEKQVYVLSQTSKDVGLVYCWFDTYRGNDCIGTRRPILTGHVFDDVLLNQPLGNASTLLCRREVVERIGGFDEELVRGNDGDFIRRIARQYKVELVPEVLVHYFVDHAGHRRITGNTARDLQYSIKSHEAKLQKFDEELKAKPALHAALLLVIARHYARLGNWQVAARYCVEAVRLEPTLLRCYKDMARCIRDFLFRQAST